MKHQEHYDTYNYRKFWQGRNYEHQAEIICLNRLFQLIPHLKPAHLLDLGAGYGRLASFYLPQVSSALLVEPSLKMRRHAKTHLTQFTNFKILKGKAENIPAASHKFDITICFRLLHHLPDPEPAISQLARVTKPEGFLILEFANKSHFKSHLRALFSGNLHAIRTPSSISRLSQENLVRRTIPFVNHHYTQIVHLLQRHGFSPKLTLSLSNYRSPFLKRLLPVSFLLFLERLSQAPLAMLHFGPSLVILAKKTS